MSQLGYESNWIAELESEEHFSYYYKQIGFALEYLERSQPVLEIGPGAHMLRDTLTRKGFSVTTLDIDAEKSPDILGCLSDFPFDSGEYRQVLAFEEFEHVSIEKLSTFVDRAKIGGVARIILSVPMQHQRLLRLRLDTIRASSFDLDLSFPRLWVNVLSEFHHWELAIRARSLGESRRTVTLAEFQAIFRSRGFSLEKLDRLGGAMFFLADRED